MSVLAWMFPKWWTAVSTGVAGLGTAIWAIVEGVPAFLWIPSVLVAVMAALVITHTIHSWSGKKREAPTIGNYYTATHQTFYNAPVTINQPMADEPPQMEKLPGLAVYAVIKLLDLAEIRRRYVFDFGTPEGSQSAFYLSASDKFTFLVTDVHGESYPLEVAVGHEGVPLGELIMLVCELGISSNSTFLRVKVSGKTVATRKLGFPIDVGSRKWRLAALGADASGKNAGAFMISEIVAWPATWTTKETSDLETNVGGYFKLAITT